MCVQGLPCQKYSIAVVIQVAIRFIPIDGGGKEAIENQEHSFAEADPNYAHNSRSRGSMASHHPNTNGIEPQNLRASNYHYDHLKNFIHIEFHLMMLSKTISPSRYT